jgi:hypothetical protein
MFFILMNVTLTNTEGSFGEIYHLYYENNLISNIYKISTYFDLILIALFIIKLILSFKDLKISSSYLSYLILFICAVSIFLFWFELYYGSTFYYGEVRDKQALYFCSINNGLIGSILFSVIFLKILLNKFDKTKNKKIVLLNLSILIILLHFVAYKLLETPWDLWAS